MTAGEIAEHFDMKKPSVSHHLSTLAHASLVYSEKKGQYVHYSLNMTMLQEIVHWTLTFKND